LKAESSCVKLESKAIGTSRGVVSAQPTCLLAVSGLFHTGGGMATLSRLTVRALAEQGCHVDILSLNEHDASIDTRYVPQSQASCRVFGGSKLRFAAALWQAVLRTPVDFVIFDHVNLAVVLAPLASLRLVRYAVWLCGIEVFPPRPDFEGTLGLHYAWRRLAISSYTRDSVVGRFPGLPVDVCDLALDPVRHEPAVDMERLEAPGLPIILKAIDGVQRELSSQVVLHVGRMAGLERFKGQDVLLWAFPEVREHFPKTQLVLVGEGGDRSRLLEIARSLPAAAQQQVFMPGYADDDLLKRLYRACYLLAMPSIGEGFGLVYLEAMSRGKPCLGARADATPFVVRDGLTGILVDDPRSQGQIVAALKWFLANPAQAQTMGQAGYELVRTYYLFEHFKARFWKALQN
jgi:phosphatidyl-myo-inositol dimannoside synthase